MDRIEYKYIDKSEWPDGEWNDEFDKAQWQDEETDLPCLIVRGPSGALCGYVGVPNGHQLYGLHYDAAYDKANISVHGGLTYSDRCNPQGGGKGICHAVSEGESDDVWWLGFDCAHAGDLCPSYANKLPDSNFLGEAYRDVAYVESEVRSLAKQIAAA